MNSEVMLPRLKPVASLTWEVRDLLLGTELETARSGPDFPGRWEIVGMHPTVIVGGDDDDDGLLTPTVDDLLVMLDIDQKDRFTSAQGQSTAAARSQSFVTLSALDAEFRDMYIELTSDRPVVGVQFRWKRFTQGTPLYKAALISLAMFVREKGGR